jgi:tripartite-type tricarboxylate transporter receptor subunit TctC
MKRFQMHRVACCLLLMAALAPVASAQPSGKAVKLVVESGPGSASDATARVLAESLSEVFGKPVIVENKPGAEGAIAAEAVRVAAPDGQTLALWSFSTLVAGPLVYKQAAFDPIKDFTPISLVGHMTMALSVHPAVPARTLGELIEHARAHPGKLNYAAIGAMDTVLAALLMNATGISMTRVRYKSPAQSLPDAMAGRIDIVINPAALHAGPSKEGRLRTLVIFDKNRNPGLPEVPAVAEAGVPRAELTPWYGVFGPANMPREAVEKLSIDVQNVLARPDVRAKLERRWMQVESSSAQGLAAFLRGDIQRWSRISTEIGLARATD